MRILKPGVVYELRNYSDSENKMIVSFLEQHMGTVTTKGTSNEEVFRMLLHRMQYLNTKYPSVENAQVILKLEECLMWLKKRSEKRQHALKRQASRVYASQTRSRDSEIY
jgi:hypothetical protein